MTILERLTRIIEEQGVEAGQTFIDGLSPEETSQLTQELFEGTAMLVPIPNKIQAMIDRQGMYPWN